MVSRVGTQRHRWGRRKRWIFALTACLVLALPISHSLALRKPVPLPDRSTPEWRLREDAFRRGQIFLRGAENTPIDLARHPYDARPFDRDTELTCRYVPKVSRAVSAKFDCELPSGEIVKVKYGGNWEIPAEIASTRLLANLGLASDYVSLVRRVRCYGCPPRPFGTRRMFQYFYAGDLYDHLLVYRLATDFDWVSVERKFEARPFETADAEGWSFDELDRVDPSAGGATRDEVDALRLLAVFLSHFDNKPNNQRLVCLEDKSRDESAAPCREPVLMLHDVGATFGPRKAWYHSWATTPIWRDDACLVSMDTMPHGGVTFRPVHISEGGRQLLAAKLRRLTDAQIAALFTAARFPDPLTGEQPAGDLAPWVRTFQEKVRAVADRPACPSTPAGR